MIYLIGGPPKCGKTTLAKQISKTAGIPWVSTDTLQNVIKPYIPEQNHPAKFPLSSLRYESNDEKYAKHSADELIVAYRHQAKTLHPAIEAFVASEIIEGNDYIVEGFHLEPELISKLVAEFPEKVRGVLVIKKDPTAFVENIHSSTTPNDWIIKKTKDEATFPKIAAVITAYSAQLENAAKQHDLKVFCVDQNFTTELKAAETYLVSV